MTADRVTGPLGLLYDVHGNLLALEAVLDDAATLGVRSWVVGGDVALFGPHPVETLERLRALPAARWLRGNGERWMGAPSEAPGDPVVQGAIADARALLDPVMIDELAGMPESIDLGSGTRAWHGSPVSDVRSFLPAPTADETELLAGVTERRLLIGHTHLPFARTARGAHGPVELVNPGSVGMSLDGDRRAAYAVVHDDGAVEHRRVAYDSATAAAAARTRGGPQGWGEVVARRIERAAFVD